MTDFIVAEAGIRQLYARCVDAVWRKDTEAFVDCFVDDGEWKIAGMHLLGRAEIGRGFEAFLAANQRVLMSFGTPILEVMGSTASGRSYTTEHIKRIDGQAISSIGIYYERFVGEGNRWRFQWRHFDMCYLGPPDLSGPFYEFKNYGPPPAIPGHDDPTAGLQVER